MGSESLACARITISGHAEFEVRIPRSWTALSHASLDDLAAMLDGRESLELPDSHDDWAAEDHAQ